MVMAERLREFHGVMTVLWAVTMPVAVFTGWIYSLAFISVISIYANFAGHFSSWQASRVEVNQEKG
jgi:hypothetical protein